MQFEDVLKDCRANIAPSGHHHARAGWVNFDCPFCGNGTNKYHMGYNSAGRYVNCWRCGKHSIVSTLTELGVPYRDAKAIFGSLDIDLAYVKPERTTLKLPKAGDLLPAHRKYLKRRGFDPDEITQLWDVRGIGPLSRLRWRILIPIYLGDEIVSWTTRTIGNAEPRYISASPDEESVDHKELLYGEQYVRHGVIVHEGPFDVWATGPGAVATLGTGVSPGQILRLSRFPIRGVCFDRGREAQRRARRLCDALEVFPGETYNIELETGDDPAEASRREIRQLRKAIL